MECEGALRLIGEWLRIAVEGRKPSSLKGNVGLAFQHIRECQEKKCSLVREQLIAAKNTAIGLGEGIGITFKY